MIPTVYAAAIDDKVPALPNAKFALCGQGYPFAEWSLDLSQEIAVDGPAFVQQGLFWARMRCIIPSRKRPVNGNMGAFYDGLAADRGSNNSFARRIRYGIREFASMLGLADHVPETLGIVCIDVHRHLRLRSVRFAE